MTSSWEMPPSSRRASACSSLSPSSLLSALVLTLVASRRARFAGRSERVGGAVPAAA